MGLWEFLRQWEGSRHTSGIVLSLAVHVVLIAALLLGHPLSAARQGIKPGDALIVELPNDPNLSAPGNTQAPAAPAPPRPAPSPRVAARPAPARPSPPQSPQPPQQAEAPRRVASTPRESEPVAPAQPAPAPAAVPAPPAPIAAPPPAPEAPTQPVETATRSENTTPSPAPARGESERPPDSPPGSQVAALPPASSAPSGRAYVPDIRSLGRGSGGAGGLHGAGRGGVEGDPVSLDTGDPRYSDYLILVKRAIEHNMTWPCVRSGDGRTCDHKPARLVIEFGIRKNGELAFIAIRQPSNYRLMDEVSENAVKLASFPPLPEAIRREHPTGLPILANFLYEFNLNWVIR